MPLGHPRKILLGGFRQILRRAQSTPNSAATGRYLYAPTRTIRESHEKAVEEKTTVCIHELCWECVEAWGLGFRIFSLFCRERRLHS